MEKIESKYFLPNAVTAMNMLLGFLSITMSFQGKFHMAAWLILLAMIFDALDGFVARKMNAFSEFGKEFDSFCDSVSFGLAPGILIFALLSRPGVNFPKELITPLAFMYALSGVVRLVKFNVVTTASSSKDDFSGMPIPNAANLIASYYLFMEAINQPLSPKVLVGLALISAILMVSTLPFKIPQKTFAFIPKKLVLPILVVFLYYLEYTLFPLGVYYILANLYVFINSRGNNDEL